MLSNWASRLAVILAFSCAGCGTHSVDYPLSGQQRNQDRRSIVASLDHPFVVLAFSGGGSRAAVLAAAITARLDGITYQTPAGPRRLSQDIAVVSSVSGGSVYAAYLALNGASEEKARAFEQRIGDFDGIGYLSGRLLNPITWISLQLENKTRVDLLQDMITKVLGTKATLAEFNKPNQPLVLLNASDMVAGEVFTFDPATLDDLCMNYDQIPVALATTASAAFPIAFTPVLLQNHSYVDTTGCPGRQMPAADWRNELTAPGGRYANLEEFRLARYRDSLRGARYNDLMPNAPSFRQPRYVRLVDGGVIDNLGLTAVRRALSTSGSPVDMTPLIQERKLSRLVVIVVNARSDAPSPLDASPEYTTIPKIALSVAGALVDSAAAGAASTFRGFVRNLVADRATLLEQHVLGAEFDIYPIDIDFDQLPDSTVEERDKLNKVKSIKTSWTLAPGDVPLIDQVAGELLWRHPCFRKLVTALGVETTPEAPAVPNLMCPVPPLRK